MNQLSPKEIKRAAKAAKQAAVLPESVTIEIDPNAPIDCACVIHGDAYSWKYVDTLYSMLTRNLSRQVRMHVYTEHDREVPPHMIKHVLTNWPGVQGAKKSWWYKMQLFNPDHYAGQLLYLDLDTVVVNNLDWITQLSPHYFWAIRDFITIWNPESRTINSSVMYWNTIQFADVWTQFDVKNIAKICAKYRGDQDYLSAQLPIKKRRFFPDRQALSWRWQAHDGGINPVNRLPLSPGLGTRFGLETSLLIFHGQPKPDQVQDPIIKNQWR